MTDTATTAVESKPVVKSRRGRRIMALVLIVLIILLGVSSFLLFRLIAGPSAGGGLAGGQTADDGLVWVRSIYGMGDAEELQLDRTQAAVPGPDGSIWITDTVHQSLMRFSPDGRYISSIVVSEETTFVAPSRLAIDGDGTMYVCDTAEDVVRVIGSNGVTRANIVIPEPVSVDIDEEHIVVGSVSGFAILEKENGRPVQVIGSRGKGDDQFDYVHGVAIGDDGTIFVTDAFNNRISAWDKEGNRLWIRRLGKPQNSAVMEEGKLAAQDTSETAAISSDEALQLPLSLTLDGAGRVVVIDMFDSQIAVFDPKDGKFIARYGEIGSDDGKFMYPQSIGYDAERDWFTVADSLNNRVQVVRIPGSAGSNAPVAAVQRALSGPLRACLFPLALLLLAIIVWVVSRVMRRRSANAAGTPAVAVATTTTESEDSIKNSVS